MKKTFYLIITALLLLSVAGCSSKKERLTASTLTIAIDPVSISTLSAGQQVVLTAVCKSAKSDNVDIVPTWSVESNVENNLGTFNPSSGKSTIFTAASVNATGKIYASYADVRSAGVSVVVGTGGGSGGTTSGVLYADAGMSTDLSPVLGSTNMLHYFDGGDGTRDNAPWLIDVQDESSGCSVDSLESMKVTYTDVAGGWGGFYLEFTSQKNMSAYSKVTFYAKGATGGEKFKIKIKDADGASAAVVKTVTSSWQKIEIPLSDFAGVDSSKIIQPFVLAFENALAAGNATVYIDYIKYE